MAMLNVAPTTTTTTTTTIMIIMTTLLTPSSSSSSKHFYNVLKHGAKPDGKTDSSHAFLHAWEAACNARAGVKAIISVPQGRYLMLQPIVFRGFECKGAHITFRILGNLVGPADYMVLGSAKSWLGFERVSRVTIHGGALDAKGSGLWACKEAHRKCPPGATTLRFTNSNNIMIKGLKSLNSQLFHIVINRCQNVHLHGVQVKALGNSPNTDGIHVQQSSHVTITASSLSTGDDCISIGPGTENLWIEQVACSSGHGISIGSLAKDMEEDGVQDVTIKKVVLSNTTNGLRIKSWGRPSKGFVEGILFENIVMRSVMNPIIVDQNYCPHDKNCPGQESGVSITNVTYRRIRGTSATEVAMSFDCSSSDPCSRLKLENINLTYKNIGDAQSFCNNAEGEVRGVVQPKGCF